ncbi:MAG: hypothetical protein KatS3mg031_2785 [Chitinophagales bacterium]|nr:MAG: hypothetical protein KatS3mg031_2785 [Chitinophagales bacterium]
MQLPGDSDAPLHALWFSTPTITTACHPCPSPRRWLWIGRRGKKAPVTGEYRESPCPGDRRVHPPAPGPCLPGVFLHPRPSRVQQWARSQRLNRHCYCRVQPSRTHACRDGTPMSAQTYAVASRPMLLAAKTLAPSHRVLRNRSHGRPVTTIVMPMVQLPHPGRSNPMPHVAVRASADRGSLFFKKKAGAYAGGLGDKERSRLRPPAHILLLMVVVPVF